jgi:hypothetical protein
MERLRRAGEGTALVWCWWCEIDEGSRILSRSSGLHFEGYVLPELVKRNFTGNASTPLMRREAVLQAGGYDERLRDRGAQGCEDHRLALAIAQRHEFALVPRHLVGYRRGGAMSADIRQMKRSHEIVMTEIQRRHPELPPSLFVRSSSRFDHYLATIARQAGRNSEYLRLALGVGIRDPLYCCWHFLGPERARALFAAPSTPDPLYFKYFSSLPE